MIVANIMSCKTIVSALVSHRIRRMLNDRGRPHKSQSLKGALLYKMGKGKIVRNFYEPALEGRFYGNITKITLEERMYL